MYYYNAATVVTSVYAISVKDAKPLASEVSTFQDLHNLIQFYMGEGDTLIVYSS